MKLLLKGSLIRRWFLFGTALILFAPSEYSLAQSSLTGIVTHSLTGSGVVGAVITVNTASAWSVTAGIYALTVPQPGTFTVTCNKPGYTPFTSAPILFQTGVPVVLNISLQESANPPVSAMAVLDTAEQEVRVMWQAPAGSYEMLYDDGLQDNFTVWAAQGNMNGVRFSPPAFPASVSGGSVHLGKASDYPPGSNPLVPFQVSVYKANGTGGMPGTLLGGPFDIIPSHLGWVTFTFPSPVTVTNGDFYLVMIQGGNAPDAAGLAVDETFPKFRSVQRFMTGAGPWVPSGGNFMFRAVAEGPGGPVLLTDDGKSLTGYHIWRLRQGEEQNPIAWTDLGETTGLELTDPGWNGFPCGPYCWGIRALYPGNRQSAVSFTNLLPKCWTAGVTVISQLTCTDGNKGGTGVRLENMVYPDTVYSATMDTSGITHFQGIWKGAYELRMTKFGYQEQILPLPVSHDTTIQVLLLQEKPPPRDLEVGEKTLIAHWQQPEYKTDLLSEDWSSAGFTANGWIPSGGYNWVISTVEGNPLPSAMFGWSPQVIGYDQSLTSRTIDTEHAPVLTLKYDITLDNFGTTTLNQMAAEAWDGNAWHVLSVYDNSAGSFPWTSVSEDLSGFTGQPLKIRFRATGGDSYDINGWYVDNISVEASETQAGLTNCVLGYNVYLNSILSGFTTDTKYTIPGDQVEYGQTYQCCVNAVFGSGWSPQICVPFTSGFLYPPENLSAVLVEDAAFLDWDKPETEDTSGQMVAPPGLAGYRIYRNSMLIDSIQSPDETEYYDLQLEPGTYDYTVTAWYDLTPYGYPGLFDESMAAGPASLQVNYGLPLPFFEPWNHATFTYNDWQFPTGQGNWTMRTDDGNPLPSAAFMWEPLLTDYKYTLQSPALDGSPYHCGSVTLEFDLACTPVNPTGTEQLLVGLYYEDAWHTLAAFGNDSAFTWTRKTFDIPEVEGHGFRIAFTAAGNNSADLLWWGLDNIYVYAECFGPTGLTADVQGLDVHLSWIPPDCTGANMYLDEGFEEEWFPPLSWYREITNPATTWSQMDPLSPVGVHSGNHSAGVLWDYVHQDEWLVAENVIVNGNLEFWSYAFQGSAHGDHYYVKVSPDEGLTWDVLMDLSALPPYPGPGGYNQWNEPYLVDLTPYLGDVVSIAWQAVDGDGQGVWYSWGIDDCKVGSKELSLSTGRGAEARNHWTHQPESLLGYDVYRKASQDPDFAKVNLNTVTDTFYVDTGLPPGAYEYFVSPLFTECSLSATTDTVVTDVITGLSPSKDEGWQVFPVPASGRLTLTAPDEIWKIEILSLTGVLMGSWSGDGPSKSLEISNLTSGVYLLRATADMQIRYFRIVIK